MDIDVSDRTWVIDAEISGQARSCHWQTSGRNMFPALSKSTQNSPMAYGGNSHHR